MRLDMAPGRPPIDRSALAGKVALVTGARGFLGSRLSDRLQVAGARVLCLGRRHSAAPVAGPGMLNLTHDVCDAGVWTTLPEVPDLVFHLAAQTSVPVADDDPARDWRANVQPLLELLETCRTTGWRPGILFAGSATQFGRTDRWPVDETFPDRPLTMYDRHKLMAEAYLEHYARRGWARGATLRLPNVYGPGPASGAQDRGVLNAMMRRALRGEPLHLYGDGHPVRDYLFVDDAMDGFLAAAVHLDEINGEHFVLGTGVGHTIAEAFELVADRATALTGTRVLIESVTPPIGLSPIEVRQFVADASRFRGRTGWTARTTLEEGIDLTLRSLAAERAAGHTAGGQDDDG
jgi:UDP-glucose 4-epimerase